MSTMESIIRAERMVLRATNSFDAVDCREIYDGVIENAEFLADVVDTADRLSMCDIPGSLDENASDEELIDFGNATFIRRAFTSVLARDPEEEAFRYFLPQLRKGHVTYRILINDIYRSPEVRGVPAPIDGDALIEEADRLFVKNLYVHFLGRRPSQEEENSSVQMLNSISRAQLTEATRHSPEAVAYQEKQALVSRVRKEAVGMDYGEFIEEVLPRCLRKTPDREQKEVLLERLFSGAEAPVELIYELRHAEAIASGTEPSLPDDLPFPGKDTLRCCTNRDFALWVSLLAGHTDPRKPEALAEWLEYRMASREEILDALSEAMEEAGKTLNLLPKARRVLMEPTQENLTQSLARMRNSK